MAQRRDGKAEDDTDEIKFKIVNGDCRYHIAHRDAINRNHDDIETIWKDGVYPLRKEIDGMKKWVIAGMASLILQLGFWILNVVTKVNTN